jgi:hypothetical protein
MTVQRSPVKQALWVAALGGTLAAYACVVRPRLLGWGATSEERSAPLPGDALLSRAGIQATRAITVHAHTDRVWPWIAQMGQGRGGLYSYDWLENLVGCQMESADRIVQEWQAVAPGDVFRLHPEAELEVAYAKFGRALVLRGGVQLNADRASPFHFSWAFVLQPRPDGTTRLIVRERYQHDWCWARLITEPVQAVSCFMTEKMLRGIRDRAETAPIRVQGSVWTTTSSIWGSLLRSTSSSWLACW